MSPLLSNLSLPLGSPVPMGVDQTDGRTLSNPNTSEEAKKHAREELKKMGVDHE